MSRFGAMAGGIAAGLETGERIRLAREADARSREAADRDKERFGWERSEAGRRQREAEELEKLQQGAREVARGAFERAMGMGAPAEAEMPAGEGGEVDDTPGLRPAPRRAPASPFGREGALAEAAKEVANFYASNGRVDLADKHLKNAAAMRADIRRRTAGDAYAQLKAGNPSLFIHLYNDMWDNGVKIDPASFTVGANARGERVYSMEMVRDGQRIPQQLTELQVQGHLAALADPTKSMEQDYTLSRARAEKSWEWANNPEIELKRKDSETRAGTLAESIRHHRETERLRGREIEALRDYREAALRARRDGSDQRTTQQLNDLIEKGALGYRKLIEAEQSKEDSKLNANGMMTLLPAMKGELGARLRKGDSPETAFEAVYYEFKDRIASLSETVNSALKAAEDGNFRAATKNEALARHINAMISRGGWTAEEVRRLLPATRLSTADNKRVLDALGAVGDTRPVGGGPGLAPKPPKPAPRIAVGDVVDGYEFLGGDPNSPSSWKERKK